MMRYAQSGLLVMCFTAQANGLFSKAAAVGGYEALARQEKNSGKRGLTGRYQDPDNVRREETARRLCRQYGITPAALTVAYLTSQDFDVVPILGCSRAVSDGRFSFLHRISSCLSRIIGRFCRKL